MLRLCDLKSCTGCSACMNACLKGCITMQMNAEGFIHPIMDEQFCISCGKCEKSCPVLHSPVPPAQSKAYAAINVDNDVRENSTSGGIFTLLSEYIIEKGGIVFGAAYCEDFSVSHQYVKTADPLQKFHGAKYVQSNIGLSYRQAKEFLDDDRYVLFSGTPCQIEGLQSFLGKPYEKLICVDLICHGIPSPEVWQHYVKYRADIDNGGTRPIYINMRSKSTGWQRYSVAFQYADQKYSSVFTDDPYMYGYIKDLFTRPSCFDCKFKGINRNSDFTLGDFWGIEGQQPAMNDNRGTSLVFVHSEKADEIWNAVSDKIRYEEVETDVAIQWNPMAVQSTSYQEKREEFFARYLENDFEQLVWELVPKPLPQKTGLFVRIKNKIGRMIEK